MKTLRLHLSFLTGLLAALTLQAATAPKSDTRAGVIFFERGKFTDAKADYMDSPKGRDAILDELRDYLVSQATKWYVPEGWKLMVTITDVDLAGDFEPGRTSRLQDIRIVRDIYPPKISLAFKLTDVEGHEVKHGTRELTDLMFMNKLALNSNDPLRHEKELLDDWLRADLGRVK